MRGADELITSRLTLSNQWSLSLTLTGSREAGSDLSRVAIKHIVYEEEPAYNP